jgi:hypothetical protein
VADRFRKRKLRRHIAPQQVRPDVRARRSERQSIQQGAHLLGSPVVVARELHFLVADLRHSLDRSLEIPLQQVADAVELDADAVAETGQ